MRATARKNPNPIVPSTSACRPTLGFDKNTIGEAITEATYSPTRDLAIPGIAGARQSSRNVTAESHSQRPLLFGYRFTSLFAPFRAPLCYPTFRLKAIDPPAYSLLDAFSRLLPHRQYLGLTKSDLVRKVTSMIRRTCVIPGITLAFFACALPSPAADSATGIRITEQPDRLRVEINGQLFTEYFFKDVPRPYFYPLIGPGGAPMTRNWPMKNTPDEEHDHPHHRSLWFAHGEVNGHDFWSEAKNFGKIVHRGFGQIKSGANLAIIESTNQWVAADGTIVCTDERTMRFHSSGAEDRSIDFEVTLHAPKTDVTFGDTKEGTMAIRLAETMRLKGKVGHGHIINSEGVQDDATWGKRAGWCDYYGPVDGKTVGIAIFDHPGNPRHPTWWHVRDYGLFAANPFGRHDFEKLPDKEAGNFVIPAGKSATFRYRIYIHPGDEKQAHVAQKYQDYVKSISPKP